MSRRNPAVLFFLLIAICSCLSFAACGSGSTTKGSASATAVGGTSTAFAGTPTKITMSYVGVANEAPLWIAKDAGIFAKNGLDVSFTVIPGPQAAAALAAGQIQAADAGASEMLNAAANGADLLVVMVTEPVFPFKLYVSSRIKTAADLKGKKVGITSPGGAYDTALRQALPKLGLEPDKDVTFVATGSVPNVTTAMLSGAIDGAAIQAGPDSIKIESAGTFHVLFDFASINVPNAFNSLTVQKSYANAHRDVVQRLVDSYIEANLREKQDKALANQVMKKYLKMEDENQINTIYSYYTQDTVQVPVPAPKPEQFTTYIQQLSLKNEKVKTYDINQLLDASYVQNAVNRGLTK